MRSNACSPAPVSAALTERSGPYAPYLDLALALESPDTHAVHAGAGALHVSQAAVNQALLQALAATDALQSVV